MTVLFGCCYRTVWMQARENDYLLQTPPVQTTSGLQGSKCLTRVASAIAFMLGTAGETLPKPTG